MQYAIAPGSQKLEIDSIHVLYYGWKCSLILVIVTTHHAQLYISW